VSSSEHLTEAMDRPCEQVSHGRRHIRAGSVHVSELIRNQPLPFELPSPGTEPSTPPGSGLDGLLDPTAAPSSHRRPVSKAAQAAKIAGLGVASFALCASIAYGSMITHERREHGTAAVPPRPTMDISGEQALLPDRLNSVVPKGGITGLPQLPGPPINASDTIDNPGPNSPMASPPGHQGSPSGPGMSRGGEPTSKKELVEQFYRLVPTWPAQAFTMLDSNLLGTDLNKFVQSWSTVTGLEVIEVSERDDNVFAVVRLRLPDGSHLRVQQLLDVANTTPRKIVGAEILSAQRN
jgi:hypothetical protein